MRHPFQLQKFQTRLIVALCLMIIMASAISFIVSIALNNSSLRKEIAASQRELAIFALEVSQKTDLPPEDIASIFTTTINQVEVYKDISDLNLPSNLLGLLSQGEIISMIPTDGVEPFTYFSIRGSLVKISVRSHMKLFQETPLRAFYTLTLTLASFFLFIFTTTGRMVRPITRLSEATRKVAAGDFSVRLPILRDDELGMLSQNFNHMTEELQSIEYLQKDFISNVSHEFKTPIASIQGFATLLISPQTTEEERKEYASIILKESQRLSRLSQNLLRLSKLEYQQRLTTKEPFSLDEQLRQTVLLLEPEWSKKNITWNLELEGIEIYGDAELMQQVWINLLGNAIKFSYTGGEINLSLYNSDTVKVKVKDFGPGMDENTQQHIFERFYQGDTSHAHEGNGLGLPLAKRIIDLHGGNILVKSTPGKGTTFIVELHRGSTPERSQA